MDYLDTYEESQIDPYDILIFSLHDAIEDHPDCWKGIIKKFGVEVFRDVLVLSTGGIPLETRREMIEYFFEKYGKYLQDDLFEKEDNPTFVNLIREILRILSPVIPDFKSDIESQYAWDGIDFQAISQAVDYYKRKIFQEKKWLTQSEISKNQEYLWLGNYLFFKPSDARRKLHDMLNNMWDMKKMEEIKPGYIETRRVKAYILLQLLKKYGMQDEISLLQSAFQDQSIPLLTDNDIHESILNQP